MVADHTCQPDFCSHGLVPRSRCVHLLVLISRVSVVEGQGGEDDGTTVFTLTNGVFADGTLYHYSRSRRLERYRCAGEEGSCDG